ncbi:hypothetical protein [Nonlabens sp. Asnod2-A12]|uniref:hypothetical protein n=1 Tax=Nonlabens sp. Asnod2-A12 TaxID=3160578 RepID=UPI0038691ED1
MRSILFTLFLLVSISTTAQTIKDLKEKAKKEFADYQEKYDSQIKILEENKNQIIKASKKNPDAFVSELKKILKAELDLQYLTNKVSLQMEMYHTAGISYNALDSYFSLDQLLSDKNKVDIDDLFKHVESPEIKPNEYLLLTPDQAIEINNSNESNAYIKAITDGISKDSETHFGTFIIPKKNKEVNILLFPGKKKEDTIPLNFKKVDLELKEGSIVDIRVILIDKKGNSHLFTNRTPISFLHFDKTASLNYLSYANEQTNYSEKFEDHVLRVSDVITYQYDIGGNYVPDDMTFSFPLNDVNDKSTNSNAPAAYRVKQSTALNNVIEFRAYTDALALADSQENGLASFEAQAIFFLQTANVRNTNLFILKKVRPFAIISRFEGEDKLVKTESEGIGLNRSLIQDIDLLQKSTFRTGIDIDLVTYKVKKEALSDISLFFSSWYQSALLQTDEENSERYSSLGLGGGLRIELKRFENLSLTYTLDLMDYHIDSQNDLENISDPKNFLVLGNQFELEWYPVKSKKNSLFARFRTNDDLSINSDGHFFQAELGYRFSLGAGKIKGSN